MIKPIFKSPTDTHYFTGYYDKIVLDSEQSRLLAMQVTAIDRLPNRDDKAIIGYFQLQTRKFVPLTETNAFNWQQGAMLQWLGPDFDRYLLFNKRESHKFVCALFDCQEKTEQTLGPAIYTVDPQARYALCIDFERHYWCRRGYSYDGIIKPAKNKPHVAGDGIWLLELSNGNYQQLLTVEELISHAPLSSMVAATHYVEHLMFAPCGTKFAFYHRWKLKEGGIYARLYTYCLSSRRFELLHDTGRLCHYCWLDDSTLLVVGARKKSIASRVRESKVLSKVAKFALPFYRKMTAGNVTDGQSALSRVVTGDTYFTVHVTSKKTAAVFADSIDRDGHPSALPTQADWIVTDTYPDKKSQAKLLLGNLSSQTITLLDELDSIAKYDNTPSRCDLHPKVSIDGRFVTIDTMNDGVRGVYLYKLAEAMQ